MVRGGPAASGAQSAQTHRSVLTRVYALLSWAGFGGHCIPVDPFCLSWKVKEVGFEARFLELAGQVNGAMLQHVIERITDALNEAGNALKGANILVLVVAHKSDVGDVRESPALDVMALLLERRDGTT